MRYFTKRINAFLSRLLQREFSILENFENKLLWVGFLKGISSFLIGVLPVHIQQALGWFIAKGIIHGPILVPPFIFDIYFPQYTAKIATAGFELRANGIGRTNREAFIKAVGEAVERYCLGIKSEKEIRYATRMQIKNAISPESFAGPSGRQRASDGWEKWRIKKHSFFSWVRGVSLLSGKEIWVPAQLVYKPYIHQQNEPIIYLPTTNGAAASVTQEGAILHGILEILEREAFLITYLNRLSPSKINLSKSDPILRDLALEFKYYNLELSVYVLATDAPIWAMLAVICDESGRGPVITVGAKADSNPIVAALGAILEANHTRVAIRRQLENGVAKPENYTGVIYSSDHALFWTPLSRMKDLDFLKGGAELCLIGPQKINDISANLSKLLEFFRMKLLDVFWVDLTLPAFKESGIFVGKAISPQIHPLFIDERYPYYGGERLYRLPVELGYLRQPLAEHELNRIPHPFP